MGGFQEDFRSEPVKLPQVQDHQNRGRCQIISQFQASDKLNFK